MYPKVKICCISSHEEANLALQHGATALGLVGHMPSGPGIISDELICSIASATPPSINTFLLTSHTRTEDIILHHQRVHTDTIQIVDALTQGEYEDIRKALPIVKIVQVVHVLDEAAIETCQSISSWVDAILLDSGNPNLPVKELGGTGRVHNWRLSRKIVENVPIPCILGRRTQPRKCEEGPG